MTTTSRSKGPYRDPAPKPPPGPKRKHRIITNDLGNVLEYPGSQPDVLPAAFARWFTRERLSGILGREVREAEFGFSILYGGTAGEIEVVVTCNGDEVARRAIDSRCDASPGAMVRREVQAITDLLRVPDPWRVPARLTVSP